MDLWRFASRGTSFSNSLLKRGDIRPVRSVDEPFRSGYPFFRNEVSRSSRWSGSLLCQTGARISHELAGIVGHGERQPERVGQLRLEFGFPGAASSVMRDTYGDRSVIGEQIIDAVRDRDAFWRLPFVLLWGISGIYPPGASKWNPMEHRLFSDRSLLVSTAPKNRRPNNYSPQVVLIRSHRICELVFASILRAHWKMHPTDAGYTVQLQADFRIHPGGDG